MTRRAAVLCGVALLLLLGWLLQAQLPGLQRRGPVRLDPALTAQASAQATQRPVAGNEEIQMTMPAVASHPDTVKPAQTELKLETASFALG